MISIQIVFALLIFILLYMSLCAFVLNKLKNMNGLNIGPDLKEPLNLLSLKSQNGEEKLIENLRFNETNTFFLFAETNCIECKKILSSTSFLENSLIEDLNVIFSDTEENKIGALKYEWVPNIYFLDLDIVIKNLKINIFPYFLEVDKEGLIVNKGFGTLDAIADFLQREKIHNIPGIEI